VHGGQLYEGEPGAPGGPSNPAGKLNPRLGRPAAFTGWKGELPTNVYRAASNGRLDVVVTEDQVPDPNGLLLSPDYKKLYVISTGTGPGDTGRGGKGNIYTSSMLGRTTSSPISSSSPIS
jgi:gluconolactonase